MSEAATTVYSPFCSEAMAAIAVHREQAGGAGREGVGVHARTTVQRSNTSTHPASLTLTPLFSLPPARPPAHPPPTQPPTQNHLHHVAKGGVEQAADSVAKAHRQVLGDLTQDEGQRDERDEVLQEGGEG